MIGNQLRKLRMASNLTQTKLASELGVTKQAISNWENHNVQLSIEQLVIVSKLFGVSTDYLLELDEKITLDVNGLTLEQISHLQAIVQGLRK